MCCMNQIDEAKPTPPVGARILEVGEIIQDGTYPKLFKVADIVPGDKIALSVQDTGCKLDYNS